jgi:hypothetical protein
MDKRKENVTLVFWVPGYAGITGNEEADEEAKQTLEDSIPNDGKYPPEDLSRWIKTEMAGSRQRRWEYKERTGYSRVTHRNKMEGNPGPIFPVLQRKTHTRTHPMALQRNRGRKKKEYYDESNMGDIGKEGAKILAEFVENIELYYGL